MEKLLLTIPEVGAQLGLGRSKIYQLLGEGILPVVRIGRAVRIPRQALEDLVARLQEQAAAEKGQDQP
jgi:excisionase family DNA binding protein